MQCAVAVEGRPGGAQPALVHMSPKVIKDRYWKTAVEDNETESNVAMPSDSGL